MDNDRIKQLLYNAIFFIIEETHDRYDRSEWIENILEELGATAEELQELGFTITEDGDLLWL